MFLGQTYGFHIEKARKRQALCRSKKRHEQSLIPSTSNHLEDTGNKQSNCIIASTSNHLEDTKNLEQIPTQETIQNQTMERFILPKSKEQGIIASTSYRAIENHVLLKENSACDIHLLKKLDILIRQINPYAISFQTLGEVEKAEEMKARLENRPISKVNKIFRRDRANDRRRFNIPNIDEVEMIFNNDDGEPPFERDVKVYPRNDDSNLVILNILSPNLDPMVYPLLFPYEEYSGLMDHISKANDNTNLPLGRAVILPSSFQGSDRNMRERYHDAMAIVSKFGKPDLFITFTCNPNWREIKENLYKGQNPSDRPDLLARVFHLKLSELLHDIIKKDFFGKCSAYVYTIEFQKRGLPHAHLLIILSENNKIETTECIDNFVRAEIPDKNIEPRLYDIVTRFMIHGPCSILNPHSPCMENGSCTKKFPKDFQKGSQHNANGYPFYQRRDKGFIHVGGKPVDNRYVIPYNKYLLLKFNAHINVQICTSIKSVKYIFKYVYKRYDCANIDLKTNSLQSHDEIRMHINARYVSACMWRLLENRMHDRSHGMNRLAIHLPFHQPVYFIEGQERQALEKSASRNTTLTAWFELNKNDVNARQYLYVTIPYHYTFSANKWKLRQRQNNIISRMYTVDPKSGERFFLRLLLLHVVGATSFEYLRTVNGVLYNTFKEAAFKRNLLVDDKKWEAFMEEASTFLMPIQLRQSFAFISFDLIVQSIENNDFAQRCFYIDGPGGSGKTFLYNTLMCYIRGRNQIVLPFATTGIAAILLKEGRTINSGFKLPIPIIDNSVSRMSLHSPDATVIKRSKLIIIDEATMMTKYALCCIDRLLKDIMQTQFPFGGKVILLSGDFRHFTCHSKQFKSRYY
ncbi:uncharacterized protein LOC135928643 [Gordionus sp. m RMFG-2023]|uniref:uncharacterized protein LOC135928643 n=1 Tax=Gordionus sp. m RMFG-2023 TaxID=3053472 RepID=UPI0031FD695F